MRFLNNEEINQVYRSLTFGSILQVTIDLSMGKMLENMEQTLTIQFDRSNRELVRTLLSKFPIIALSTLDESY